MRVCCAAGQRHTYCTACQPHICGCVTALGRWRPQVPAVRVVGTHPIHRLSSRWWYCRWYCPTSVLRWLPSISGQPALHPQLRQFLRCTQSQWTGFWLCCVVLFDNSSRTCCCVCIRPEQQQQLPPVGALLHCGGVWTPCWACVLWSVQAGVCLKHTLAEPVGMHVSCCVCALSVCCGVYEQGV